MSTAIRSIAIRLPRGEVFWEFNGSLVEQLGASPLIYAAIAYYVFDDPFFAEDIIEHNPDYVEHVLVWLENLYTACGPLINQLRAYYENDTLYSSTTPPFYLLSTYYEPDSEDLLIVASTDQGHHHLGNQWRVLTQSG